MDEHGRSDTDGRKKQQTIASCQCHKIQIRCTGFGASKQLTAHVNDLFCHFQLESLRELFGLLRELSRVGKHESCTISHSKWPQYIQLHLLQNTF